MVVHLVHSFLQDDFILMCNNAMTYNSPETLYYRSAKNLLSSGLKIISKVSVLPAIVYLVTAGNPPCLLLFRSFLCVQTFVWV